MTLERTQFRILYKDFLFRVVELDILTSGSEIQDLLVQFGATLAALSFVFVVIFIKRPVNYTVAAWGDQEFLMATTVAVVGLFAVLAWNALLPDRRDSLILGPLPVRIRTMFFAKTAAIATALGGCVLAINIFTGFAYPVMVLPDGMIAGLPRTFVAYWITSIAAGVFVFSTLLAIQGVASRLLSYRSFLRFSSFLQMAAFFVILTVYFLRPPLATVAGLTAPENQGVLHWLPSYWFLGLFQVMSGGRYGEQPNPIFTPLAERALWTTAIAFAIAAATYGLAWSRNLRIIVEQPDIQPGDRTRPAGRLGRGLVERLFRHPVDRAIVMFTSRTIARSRQHRLILAAYGGVGLAAALVYVKHYIYGNGNALTIRVIMPGHWWEPNQPFLAAGLLLMLFAIVGMCSVFSLPMALSANWIFRMTAVHRPAAYFDAARKSLYLLAAAPLWIAAGVVYFAIWPGRPALEHLAILILTATILVEILLYQFRKIPFACSYLPGGGNVHMRLALGGVLFISFVEIGTDLERWTMLNTARWIVLATILLAVAIWRRRRSAEFNASPDVSVQYEDYPDAAVSPLDLRQDGEWSNEQAYVDAIDPNFGRTWPERLRPFAIAGLALIAVGFLYERVGLWRDKTRFPQVGRSVDIGGRSLNISCIGEGSPTVILEAGMATSGYAWLPIQRELASIAKTCWYDRAGFGWSDRGPYPHTVDAMTEDLHHLLSAARLSGPYVLAGFSMGGTNVRVYRDRYPDEVAGLVLIDAPNEYLEDRIPRLARPPRPQFVRHPYVLLTEALGSIGVLRLLAPDPGAPGPGFSSSEWATLSALAWQTKSIAAEAAEMPANWQRLRALRQPVNLPLTVITAGLGMPEDMEAVKIQLNEELASRSLRGKHVVAWNSGHGIPEKAPDVVIDELRAMVEALRDPRI